MGKVTKSVEIEASPEKVFDFLGDMEKMNEIGKGIEKSVITSKPPYGVGTTVHTIMYNKSGGQQDEFDMEITEFEKNKKLSIGTIGKSKMKLTMKFVCEPTAKGTKLTKTTEYELPYSILGKIIDKISVHKNIEKMDEKGLRDVKKLLET